MSPFLYRKLLTIDSTLVSATLTDFPVLVSLVDTDLRDHALASGFDLVFTDDDGTTLLKWELEAWDSSTGRLVGWVKIASLPSSTDQEIYLYYGNAAASNLEDPAGVWSSGYEAVYHLAEDPSGTAPQVLDSTANALHGTSAGTMLTADLVAGQIGDGLAFEGTDDTVSMGDVLDFTGTTPMTLSVWVSIAAAAADDRVILSKQSSVDELGYSLAYDATQVMRFHVVFSAGSFEIDVAGSTALNDETWHYLVATYTGSGAASGVSLYVDSALETNIDWGDSFIISASNAIAFRISGHHDTLALPFEGTLDDVRVSSVVRSAAWILTEYNNQSDPATFMSLGAQELTPFVATDYTYQTLMTLDHTLVAGPLTDFPVLVSLVDAGLQADALASGLDIVFVAADETTLLDFEIDEWDSATGRLVAHVRLDSVSDTVDDTFYILYGYADAIDRSNAAGVWSNGYDAVWHLAQDPSSSQILDSSGNDFHGTSGGTMLTEDLVAGQVGNGLDFEGTDDTISMGNVLDTDGTAAQTISFWVQIAAATPVNSIIMSKEYDSGTFVGHYLYYTGANIIQYTMYAGAGDNLGVNSATALNTDTLHYFVVTYDGSKSAAAVLMYVDGARETEDIITDALTGSISNTEPFRLSGRGSTPLLFFEGTLDDVRVSSVVRSPEWILTEYNNQSDPAAFMTAVAQATFTRRPRTAAWFRSYT